METALVQERGLREVAKYQAILRAIGAGDSEFAEIRSRAGLQGDADTVVRRMLHKLIDLGYVRSGSNVGARATAAYRYRIDDPAFAFCYAFVTRFEAALARNTPMSIWTKQVARLFDRYIGHVFEQITAQAYRRLQARLDLPLVGEWGRWEGQDSERQSLELDIVAPLVDGRVMTGGVKWNAIPIPGKWHQLHMECLQRLNTSGVAWAHTAAKKKSPLLWVAAGGFLSDFVAAVRNERAEAY